MKYLLLLLGIALFSIAFSQTAKERVFLNEDDYTIIQLDTSDHWTWQVKGNSPSTLTVHEINRTEILLQQMMDEGNRASVSIDSTPSFPDVFEFKMGFHKDVSLSNYKRQFVPMINEKGEKEVWVNCFCESTQSPAYYETDKFNWKNEVMITYDGGSCFFHVTLNLTTNTSYDLYVNGF